MQNIKGLAALFAVQKMLPAALIASLVEASKKAQETGEAAKEASEGRTESKTSLLHIMRETAYKVATTEGWTREHFDAALALAMSEGAVEASLKAYRSTFGSYVAAVTRDENPISPEPLIDFPRKEGDQTLGTSYVGLRDLLKDEDQKEMALIRSQITAEVKVLNVAADLADLRKVLKAVQEITLPVAARKEADKATAKAGKVAEAKKAEAPAAVEVAEAPEVQQQAAA